MKGEPVKVKIEILASMTNVAGIVTHRSTLDTGWVLTHVGTGRRITFTEWLTEDEAQQAADAIATILPWESADPVLGLSDETKTRVRAALRAALDSALAMPASAEGTALRGER